MELKNLSNGIFRTLNKMSKKNLLIIDLNQNYDLYESNLNYINLNRGLVKLNNCKQIKLKNFKNLKGKFYKIILKNFKDFILKSRENKSFLIELEIFNLRNDRYNFVDRIINILIVKEIILKNKIKKLKIISDNSSTLRMFDKMNLNVEKKDLSRDKMDLLFSKFRIIKFYIKTIIFLIFTRYNKENFKSKKTNKNFFLSIFPNKFSYGKKNIYDGKNNIYNFTLSDETHLNLNLLKSIQIQKTTNNRNIINIEQFITLSEIFNLIIKKIFKSKKFQDFNSNKFIINKINFNYEINNILIKSYINRSKLEIYKKAIPRFLTKYSVLYINLYLFEYSF